MLVHATMMIRTILQAQQLPRAVSLQQCFQFRRIRVAHPIKTYQSRWKSSSNTAKTDLPRKERRRLEREAKKEVNQSKNTKIIVPAEQQSNRGSFDYDSIRLRLMQWIPNPRTPGGARGLFESTHRWQLGTRFSLALFVYFLIESEDTSPYVTDMAQGPSMLPTFSTVGDVYLRETGSWSRFLGIPITYERGDLVVFRDDSGRYAGKRIIGVEGDEILRYGEYAHLYLARPDWGIAKSQRKEVHTFEEEGEVRDYRRRITIPANCVWLEGDFPPFSVDSRHYGPIPVEWIRGRIVCRIWPWGAKRLSKSRPQPLLVEEALSGKYNLHLNPATLNRARGEGGEN
jgi:signal peptidase I